MNSPEKYPEKLLNELGIKSIQNNRTTYRGNGKVECIVEIISNNKNLIDDLFHKCYLADADEDTPRVTIGKLLLAAQEVCDSDVQNLSANIKYLQTAIRQFDELP